MENDVIPSLRRIRQPFEFRALLQGIRDAVACGLLEEVVHQDRDGLAGITHQGPWPDLVYLEFRHSGTGKRYVLSVETYHGSGGTWEEVPD